ncbi:MAG: hypothetical protein J6N53_10435 [Lachnospiraceae bacterium]|nr:hypothetical protein [Lachnospiraceae bacterium]
MVEALLAVPLYLCNWPLHIALPTVTTVLCLTPFIYYIVAMIHRKNWQQAWIILLLLAGMGWQWDAVTSLPRALIGGFPFAVIGVFLINEENSNRWKGFLGAFLCVVGVMITATTISVVGIGGVYWLLQNRKQTAPIPSLLAGSVLGGILYSGQILFYRLYPEHALYSMDKGTSSLAVLMYNIRFLPERLAEFCFAGRVGVVLIPILIGYALYRLFKAKHYRLLIISLLAILGSVYMISFYRTMQFYENSILFGQLRTILYMSFLALTILGLAGMNKHYENGITMKKYMVFPVLLIGMLCWKVITYSDAVKDENSALYNGQLVNIYSVEKMEKDAEKMVNLAHAVNADVMVTVSYARFFAYASKALYYDDPVEFYIPDCDRRLWVYQKMKERGNYRMVLFSLPVSDSMYIDLIELSDDSPVAYFEREFGLVRGGSDIWGIPLE